MWNTFILTLRTTLGGGHRRYRCPYFTDGDAEAHTLSVIRFTAAHSGCFADECWQWQLLLQKTFPVFYARGPLLPLVPHTVSLASQGEAPLPLSHISDSHSSLISSATLNFSMQPQCTARSVNTCWVSKWRTVAVSRKRSDFLKDSKLKPTVNPSCGVWASTKTIRCNVLIKQ